MDTLNIDILHRILYNGLRKEIKWTHKKKYKAYKEIAR